MNLCSYYQAVVTKKDTSFFVATLRSNEHVVFDRTLDKEKGIFEFFVPPTQEQRFLEIMHYYVQSGIVSDLQKLPHRLANPASVF